MKNLPTLKTTFEFADAYALFKINDYVNYKK